MTYIGRYTGYTAGELKTAWFIITMSTKLKQNKYQQYYEKSSDA